LRNYSSNNKAYSFTPTFDYYFSQNKFRPYLGIGVGYNFLNTSKRAFNRWTPADGLQLGIDNKIGFLFRGGFDLHDVMFGNTDLSKFSVGLEFDYIQKADVEIPNGQKIGTMNNSYVGLAVGYRIGLR